MKKITISKNLHKACPDLQLACLECTLKVESSSKNLLDFIKHEIEKISGSFSIENISQLSKIQASRQGLKPWGKIRHVIGYRLKHY